MVEPIIISFPLVRHSPVQAHPLLTSSFILGLFICVTNTFLLPRLLLLKKLFTLLVMSPICLLIRFELNAVSAGELLPEVSGSMELPGIVESEEFEGDGATPALSFDPVMTNVTKKGMLL